ncbi:MAG: alpha/beta hydrolase family protein [Clostridia bacterium]
MAIVDSFFDSPALQAKTAFRAILPDDVDLRTCPVLYLLHGMYGTYLSWCENTEIESLSKEYGIAVIMPDAKNSFYTDAVRGERYYTYIAKELPELVSRMFCLGGERHIAGLSMGGYGAFKLAFLNPGMFKTAASFSGCVDLANLIAGPLEEHQIKMYLDIFGTRDIAGTEHDMSSHINTSIPLYQRCGTEDFLYSNNKRFRSAALAAGAKLQYSEGPGEHTWPFWADAISDYIPWALKQF